MLRRPGEARSFNHSSEGFERSEFRSTHYVLFPKQPLRILAYSLNAERRASYVFFANYVATNMHNLTLPAPIEAYFAAEPNPDDLASCCTSQSVMKDEGHTIDLSYRFRLQNGLIASLEITA